jgi:hypothetical protein
MGPGLVHFHPEPVELGAEPIELGAVLPRPRLGLSLGPDQGRADLRGIGRGKLALESHAIPIGAGRPELRITVAEQGREPIGLGAGGEHVRLPQPPTIIGRAPPICSLDDHGHRLVEKALGLVLEALDFNPGPIGLGAESIELGAVLLRPRLGLSLGAGQSGAKPIELGACLLPLGPKAVPIDTGRLELRIAHTDRGREPIGLGPGGQQVEFPSPLMFGVLAFSGGSPIDQDPEFAMEPFDLAPEALCLDLQ